MIRSVVCFVNRNLGVRIVRDLAARTDLRLVAVVSNDEPHRDLPIQESLVGAPIVSWSAYSDRADSTYRADCGVSALFRHYVPTHVLAAIPEGVVNLHPSLLPHGRGSHPATWAIWEETPFGATAHRMTEKLDAGPILGQRRIPIDPLDTSFSLYAKGLIALWEIYRTEVVSWLRGEHATWIDQPLGGSCHRKQDLLDLVALDSETLTHQARDRWARAISLGPQQPHN